MRDGEERLQARCDAAYDTAMCEWLTRPPRRWAEMEPVPRAIRIALTHAREHKLNLGETADLVQSMTINAREDEAAANRELTTALTELETSDPAVKAAAAQLDRTAREISHPKRIARLQRDQWMCGYAAALANIIRYHGETTLAKMAMDSDGLTLDEFVRAGAELYDLNALQKAR